MNRLVRRRRRVNGAAANDCHRSMFQEGRQPGQGDVKPMSGILVVMGSVRFPAVVASRFRDGGCAGQAEQADRGVAQVGFVAGRVAGAWAGVFGVGDVAGCGAGARSSGVSTDSVG